MWPRSISFGKWRKNSVSSSTWMCEPSTSASLQDADLAVAQAAEVGRVARAVRVDADRHRDVVDLVVGEQAVALDFPGVEHLAAQRQDGLRLLVAAHLGAAAGRVALDQEELVAGSGRGSRSRSACPAARPRPSPCASRPSGWRAGASAPGGSPVRRASCRSSTCWFSHSSSAGLHVGRDQAQRVAAVQPLLDLALELRVEHLGREHEAGAREHVLGHQLDALGQQRVQVDEALDRRRTGRPSARTRACRRPPSGSG